MKEFGDGVSVMIGDEFDDFPFLGNSSQTFLSVQEILKNINFAGADLVLENISVVLGILAEVGNVQESLVFDTAQCYVLAKYAGLDAAKQNKNFGKHAIFAAQILLKTSNLVEIFENENYAFVSKIKMADLIFEILKKVNFDQAKQEAEFVVKNYDQKTQKDLMQMLKSVAK